MGFWVGFLGLGGTKRLRAASLRKNSLVIDVNKDQRTAMLLKSTYVTGIALAISIFAVTLFTGERGDPFRMRVRRDLLQPRRWKKRMPCFWALWSKRAERNSFLAVMAPTSV